MGQRLNINSKLKAYSCRRSESESEYGDLVIGIRLETG